MALKTVFLWPFLQKIKSSIMTKCNSLFSGILGEKLNLEMMVTIIFREAKITPEGILVSLLVSIPETPNKTEERQSIDNIVELNNNETHKFQITVQNLALGFLNQSASTISAKYARSADI